MSEFQEEWDLRSYHRDGRAVPHRCRPGRIQNKDREQIVDEFVEDAVDA